MRHAICCIYQRSTKVHVTPRKRHITFVNLWYSDKVFSFLMTFENQVTNVIHVITFIYRHIVKQRVVLIWSYLGCSNGTICNIVYMLSDITQQ